MSVDKENEHQQVDSVSINRILKQRARELAKIIVTERLYDTKIVFFKLETEQYGIESVHISRICEAKSITHLPGTPEFIEGIINNHGQIVCVVDLKKIFELKNSTLAASNHIVIINHEDISLGLLVDEISGTESILLDQLQTSLPTLKGMRSEFLMGITPNQKIILNVKNLLTHKDLIVNDSV